MADDSRLSSVVDDDGKLFGLLNVIDAVVLLLAVLILAAGVLLWAPADADTERESETRYVTLELESQPAFMAEQIREDDRMSPEGTNETLTITDTYQYTADGEINTLVRTEVVGTRLNSEDEDSVAIQFAGSPVRYGSTIELAMSNYEASGTVVAIDREGPSLQTGSESFVIQMDLDRSAAERINEGDGFELGESELVVLETVTIYPIPSATAEERRAVVGVTGHVQFDGNTPMLGNQQIRPRSELTVETQAYDLTGTVIRVGSAEEPGTPTTRTATVELSDVPLERAEAIEVGLTEQTQDTATAEILEMTDRPVNETVVVDGNVTTREDPLNRDVTLAVQVNVRELDDDEIMFRGERLEIGQEVAFDFGLISVEGQLTELE